MLKKKIEVYSKRRGKILRLNLRVQFSSFFFFFYDDVFFVRKIHIQRQKIYVFIHNVYAQNNRHNLIAKQTTYDNFLVHMQFFAHVSLPQNEKHLLR